jgi:exodeoxyribonuclease-5
MFIQEQSLLSQVFRFVGQGNPRNRILFIGDSWQLPPVNDTFSPALSPDYLKEHYNVASESVSLDKVERTTNDSYILKNAESILSYLKKEAGNASFYWSSTGSFSNGIRQYLKDFSEDPFNKAIMIALSNNQVNALNTWARNYRYHYPKENVIMPNEWMICNNNTELDGHALYKGNHFMVLDTWKPEEFAGLHFINARVEFETIYNERVSAKTKILLESVTSQNGTLSYDQEKGLIHEAYKHNRKFRESKRPTDDAFVCALRARYGYALTCHKAQGGEWNNVYLHPGYRKDDLRWVYTAVTRAIDELFSWN